jgi:hypothetical protein
MEVSAAQLTAVYNILATADAAACDGGKVGAIRFQSAAFSGCDGSAWVAVPAAKIIKATAAVKAALAAAEAEAAAAAVAEAAAEKATAAKTAKTAKKKAAAERAAEKKAAKNETADENATATEDGEDKEEDGAEEQAEDVTLGDAKQANVMLYEYVLQPGVKELLPSGVDMDTVIGTKRVVNAGEADAFEIIDIPLATTGTGCICPFAHSARTTPKVLLQSSPMRRFISRMIASISSMCVSTAARWIARASSSIATTWPLLMRSSPSFSPNPPQCPRQAGHL